jgi:hypothetical protein
MLAISFHAKFKTYSKVTVIVIKRKQSSPHLYMTCGVHELELELEDQGGAEPVTIQEQADEIRAGIEEHCET